MSYKFPDKLSTFLSVHPVFQLHRSLLGRGGINVSGGQKQRICIARALLRKPKILILDDSTSAVDSDTEQKIRHNLSQLLHDTTVFIITQRINTMQSADRVIVLEDGVYYIHP